MEFKEVIEVKVEYDDKTKGEYEACDKHEQELEDVDIDSKVKKFRLQNQKIMLTYKTHLKKEEYIAWIQKEFKPCKFIRLAHESGDKSHNYLHTHVLIDFGSKIDVQNARRFDYEGIHPNIKKVLSDKHFKNSMRYLAKEDTANADLKETKCSLAEEIWSYKNLNEALVQSSSITKLSDISGAQLLYDLKPFKWGGKVRRQNIMDEASMYPWQKEIYDEIQKFPDDRIIMWIADEVGGQGKNSFIDYMKHNHSEKVIDLPCNTTVDNTMNVLIGAIKKGWCGDTIIFNLERSTKDSECVQLYKLIEQIKDGKVMTTKYAGFHMEDTPAFHVIVLSNRYPNRSYLTGDRWRIYEIETTAKTLQEAKKGDGEDPLPYISGLTLSDTAANQQGNFNPMAENL